MSEIVSIYKKKDGKHIIDCDKDCPKAKALLLSGVNDIAEKKIPTPGNHYWDESKKDWVTLAQKKVVSLVDGEGNHLFTGLSVCSKAQKILKESLGTEAEKVCPPDCNYYDKEKQLWSKK